MGRLARFLAAAARRVASDPRVQSKARHWIDEEIKPRAEDAWRRNGPKLRAGMGELREMARKNVTRKNVEKFASSLRDRWRQKP
jgi:hypothetical protein